MLEIISFTLGPVMTNAYLIADTESKDAAVIDPADEGNVILSEAKKQGWRIGNIWLTHAHFDHLAGAGVVADGINPPPRVALHPDDYPLYRMQGGAPLFGMKIDPGPEPTVDLRHGQILHLGDFQFEVRHAPGHTQGHVVFYCSQEAVVFCGDVIFQGSIGRTDGCCTTGTGSRVVRDAHGGRGHGLHGGGRCRDRSGRRTGTGDGRGRAGRG